MTPIVFLRHGPTDWNAAGRIQGQQDIPLSEDGRAAVARWRLPAELRTYRVVTSPLARAAETAVLLGLHIDATEPRLMEMHYGAWEGRYLDELRAAADQGQRLEDRRGLDFRPAGGETPRELLERVLDWLRDAADDGRPVLAISHNGVMRTLHAHCIGWDLTGEPPVKLKRAALHHFQVDGDGRPEVVEINRRVG